MRENVTMDTVDRLSAAHAKERAVLAERVQRLNDEVEAVKRRLLPGIKSAVARSAESLAHLKAAVEDAPELFEKPKTMILHGIRVGYMKAKGKLVIDDETQTLKLINKHYPLHAGALIKTKQSLDKRAISNLTVTDLKRIGCKVEETGEVVFVAPVDGEVDKLVNKLLAEAEKMDGVS